MTRPHPNRNPERSLVADLGDVADDMRQLLTDAGMRPYRVFAIVLEWSGKEVGRGNVSTIVETELLPTPMVRMRGVRFELKTAGKTDRGFIEITEVSPRYTEDQLQRSFHVKQLTEGQAAFYEIVQDKRDGSTPVRRRFVLRGVPERDAENFQWILRVSAQDKARSRSGEPNQAGRVWRK